MITELNYGLLTINWNRPGGGAADTMKTKPLTATVRINGDNQATYLTQEITF